MTIYRIDLYFGTYTYDEVGNQISQTDANNHTTTFAYDSLGRRVKRTLPLGMSESYQYDAVGNQTKKTDFNARTTSYAYDNMNRMTQKTPDPSFSSVPITFTYTSTDQRASMTDQSGTSSYTYDNRDRLLTKATPEGIITYTYDAQGNLLSMNSSNTNGVSVNYSYDALNRLLTVVDNRLSTGNKMSTYTYDAVGNISTFTYSNGLETTYAYDTLNRLVNLHSTYGPTIASYAYTLGATGNRLSVTELSGRVVKYIYDAAYKLTNETITTDPNTINGIISYTYDPVGNRLTRNSTVSPVPNQTLTYDANDRLSNDGYDANGSTTSSGTNTYAYDFENHLINSNAGGGISVTYDGDGNRVSRTVGGTITKYLIDDLNPTGYAQVLEELTGGGVQRTYTYGLSRLTENQASGTSFYGYDGHGSVRFLMDESGTITDRYDYDAFGNLLNQTGTTPNVYLYSGEQLDSSLNLYNLRARYMNQSTGRFCTQDSYEGQNEDPISLHKYLYSNGNPVNNIDPSGHDGLLIDAAVASEIVGIEATFAEPVELINLSQEIIIEELEATEGVDAAEAVASREKPMLPGPLPFPFKTKFDSLYYIWRGVPKSDAVMADSELNGQWSFGNVDNAAFDGLSTTENPPLDPVAPYYLGFQISVQQSKTLLGVQSNGTTITELPGFFAKWAPTPTNAGHWFINASGISNSQKKKIITAYAREHHFTPRNGVPEEGIP